VIFSSLLMSASVILPRSGLAIFQLSVSLAKLPATTAIPVPSWADSRTKSCFVVSRAMRSRASPGKRVSTANASASTSAGSSLVFSQSMSRKVVRRGCLMMWPSSCARLNQKISGLRWRSVIPMRLIPREGVRPGAVWLAVAAPASQVQIKALSFGSVVDHMNPWDVETVMRGTRLVVQPLCGLGLVGRGPL